MSGTLPEPRESRMHFSKRLRWSVGPQAYADGIHRWYPLYPSRHIWIYWFARYWAFGVRIPRRFGGKGRPW